MSNSFTVLSKEHRDLALRTVQLLHEELHPITWAAVDPSVPQLDTGVQAILDKLLCMKATVFLHAPMACTGAHDPHGSSFTEEICASREVEDNEAGGRGDGSLRNRCTTWDADVV
ncbi:hypothetical protein CLOP_g4434 [Closterium sp. NIES-67]|nr:hypothetical protein CLOP_g4434 [Closterium sp. NIES-67]